MRVIRDANRLVVCNKPGTKVRTKIGALSLTYPLFGGTIDACGLFRFENMGAFYLGTLLPESHPKRAEMALNEGTLNSLLDVLGAFVDPNDVFEQSSGITGFTLKPTPEALSRFVFFGASSSLYPNMPDEDLVNADSQTNAFIRDVIEPASTSVCPKNALGVHQCASGADTLRLRDPNSMFAWERFGFHDYLRPLLTVFANEACTADLSYCDKLDFTGEQFFLDLASVLYRHWPGPDHGPECDKSGSPQTNPRYCSEAGGNLYEPILKDVFESDLIPAVVRLSGVAATQSKVTVARGPSAGDVWSGADVMEKLVRVLFSQPYSLAEGVVDRAGSASAKWVDGSFQPQATPFSLLADAFHGIDQRFEAVGDPTRRSMWKVARSQLVDELLAVDGVGENAHFRNRAAPRMAEEI